MSPDQLRKHKEILAGHLEEFGMSKRCYLVPELKPVHIVVMDNLGSHKADAFRAAIRKAGARLFLLPHTPPISISRSSSPRSSTGCARRRPEPAGSAMMNWRKSCALSHPKSA
jgi:hypothetical protein